MTIASFAAIEVVVKMPKTANSGESFVVEITINNEKNGGIARLKQEVPFGFTATPIATESADFSFENNTVKFIWKEIPVSEKIKISYNVKIDSKINGKFQFGKGEFNSINNGKSVKTVIEPKSIQVNKSSSPATPEVVSKPEVKPATETAKKTTPATPTVPAAKPNPPTSPTPSSKPATTASVPAPKGVYFRVQFQAANTKQNIEEIKSKLGITEPIYEELIDGLYKYTFGNYTTFEKASQQNTSFKQRTGTPCFVVAYENEKRIPVKEAMGKVKK